MKKILFVTSFAKDMFKESGKRLINTFLKFQCSKKFINPNDLQHSRKLLICYEKFNFDEIYNNNNLLSYDISKSEYLQNWLEKNKNIIPDYLGGTATKINNPDIFNQPDKRKASRWFRKVASLEYAQRIYGNEYDYIIWIDADCYFKKYLPFRKIKKVLNDNHLFYYMGKLRSIGNKYGYETGFVGFKKIDNEYKFIDLWIKEYEEAFLKYYRWDDGYVFRKVNEKNQQNKLGEKYKTIDLGMKAKSKHPMNDKNTIFYPFIEHNKGIHRKKNILV